LKNQLFFALFFSLNLFAPHFLHFAGGLPDGDLCLPLQRMQMNTPLKRLESATADLTIFNHTFRKFRAQLPV